MELTKEALGGLVGLYDHWQDILDTAEEIETFSGAAFAHVTEEEFLTTWQTGMVEAVDALKGLDLSTIQTILQQQISNMVAQAGGVLSKAIPDNLDTLLDNVKDYVPSDIPQRDKILVAANLIRNNVSVEIRENIPVTSSSTTPSTTETGSTQSTQTPSGSSSANDANGVIAYLLDAAFPEFERYVGNAWSLYDRLQDIMTVSNIQAVLEAELQPIRTMLTSGKTSTGGPLTAEALIGQIPTLLRKLLSRAMTMVEDCLKLLFEAIKLLVSSLKTVHSKLTSSPSSWPDSPLKSFVQQLGLEKMPGLATLPSLLISIVLVPIYKAATGERPTFSASIFQADESRKAKCDEASAWLGLVCWAADTLEAGLGAFEVRPGYRMVSNWGARSLALARGILDIKAFYLPESDDEPDDPPETDDEKEQKRLETAEAWVNFTKDVGLVAISSGIDVGLYGYYRSKLGPLKGKTDWEEAHWYKRWFEYRDSLWIYNWYNQVSDTVTFLLEIAALGLGGSLVARERQEDASYDMRDHAAKMLGSSLSIVDGIVGLVDSWRDEDKNLKRRSLTLDGKLGVTGEKLTAKITDAATYSLKYYWCVNGALNPNVTTGEYTQAAGDSKITVVARYKAGDAFRVLHKAAGPESLSVTGEPKAGKTLTAKVPAGITNPTYTWYRTRPAPPASPTVTVAQTGTNASCPIAMGSQNNEFLHGDSIHVKLTGDGGKFYESRKLVILDTPGTLTLASNGNPTTQAKVGETITATITDADGIDASTVTFTWKAGGIDFTPAPPPPPAPPATATTATATYIVALGLDKAHGQVRHGEPITVTAKYKDRGGTTEKTLTSRAIKVVAAPGRLKCERVPANSTTINITLTDPDGIASITSAQWKTNTAATLTGCGPGAQGASKAEWTWTAVNTATTPIRVTVKYKDFGSDTEYTLSASVP